MKNLTLAPMSSYQGKIAGLIITPIALILLLVVKLHGPFLFLSKPAPAQQFNLLFAVVVLGMHMIAFSKEKNDDERVRAIRAKSLQMAFMVLMTSLIAIGLTSAMSTEEVTGDSNLLCPMAAFGLGVYLVVFHIGLYFDPAWAYNDDTVVTNIKKNKTFFVFYAIAGVILLILAFLTGRA
jgi:nitrate reductase gamma subunit